MGPDAGAVSSVSGKLSCEKVIMRWAACIQIGGMNHRPFVVRSSPFVMRLRLLCRHYVGRKYWRAI